MGVMQGLPSQGKKIIFCPKNDMFGCILPQFLTGRKHGQSLEALACGIMKRNLQKQYKKLYKNS